MLTASRVGEDTQVEVRDLEQIATLLMSELPPKQQAVMFLRDVEGCEMDEIASALGMDKGVVKVNLSRARKAVRERLVKIMSHGTK